MNHISRNAIALIAAFNFSPAFAGEAPPAPITSVPVDSPWALGALGVVVAVIAARMIRNRR